MGAGSIKKFMLYIGPLSSIFDYITFAVMYFIFKANTPEHQSLFQTGWFVEGLLSQTLIVHIIRTKKIPFIQSWAAAPVVALTSLIMLIGIMIPFHPFGRISENAGITFIISLFPTYIDSYPIGKTLVHQQIRAMAVTEKNCLFKIPKNNQKLMPSSEMNTTQYKFHIILK
jgi:Mg2+-importing ATPase